MIRVHCASLSPSLLESELFGHVKGAFTGAHQDRVGRFEAADGGTLFLDEIGDITLDTQIKLLRVLQERCFEPVGSVRTVHVDVRLITATHQNLEQLIRTGKFREDLFYRLNVISMDLPPLRDRREDILELALHFLGRAAKRLGKSLTHIDEQALELLERYAWPGNIRELENIIERAVVLAEGMVITPNELPAEVLSAKAPKRRDSVPVRPLVIQQSAALKREDSIASPSRRLSAQENSSANAAAAGKSASSTNDGNTRLRTADIERQELLERSKHCEGNKSEAARRLGLPRSTFSVSSNATASRDGAKPSSSCAVERKGFDLVDGGQSQGQHHEPVHSQRHPRAIRQAGFHRGEQAVGFRQRAGVVLFAELILLLHAELQFRWVRQFVIAVANLDALEIQLEPLGDGPMTRADFGEGRLRSRVIVQKHGVLDPQLRLDNARQQEVQPTVAVVQRKPPRRGYIVHQGQSGKLRRFPDRAHRSRRSARKPDCRSGVQTVRRQILPPAGSRPPPQRPDGQAAR